MARREQIIPALLLLITSLLWSLGGVLIKSIDLQPMAIAAGRSVIALPVLLVFLRHVPRRLTTAQIGGAIGYALTVAMFVFATRMTTAANAIFLQYTAPIYVALIGRWYLGERAVAVDWLVIAIALSGIALFFFDKLSVSGFWGNIVALASGLAFAGVALFLRKEKAGAPLVSVILGNAIVAVAGVPFLLHATFTAKAIGLLLVLGVVQLGISYVLYAIAIKHVTALEATLIPLLEPVLNPTWVMLALGERPGVWAMFGGMLVLIAVLGRGLMMVRSYSSSPALTAAGAGVRARR